MRVREIGLNCDGFIQKGNRFGDIILGHLVIRSDRPQVMIPRVKSTRALASRPLDLRVGDLRSNGRRDTRNNIVL